MSDGRPPEGEWDHRLLANPKLGQIATFKNFLRFSLCFCFFLSSLLDLCVTRFSRGCVSKWGRCYAPRCYVYTLKSIPLDCGMPLWSRDELSCWTTHIRNWTNSYMRGNLWMNLDVPVGERSSIVDIGKPRKISGVVEAA